MDSYDASLKAAPIPREKMRAEILEGYNRFKQCMSRSCMDREKLYDPAVRELIEETPLAHIISAGLFEKGKIDSYSRYFSDQKDRRLLTHLPIPRDGPAWKSIYHGEEIEEQYHSSRFTDMTDRGTIPYLVSLPTRFNGDVTGCVQFFLRLKPDAFLSEMLRCMREDFAQKEQEYKNLLYYSIYDHALKNRSTSAITYARILEKLTKGNKVLHEHAGTLLADLEEIKEISLSHLKLESMQFGISEREETDVNSLIDELEEKIELYKKRRGEEIGITRSCGKVPKQYLDAKRLVNEVLYQFFENSLEATKQHDENKLHLHYETLATSDERLGQCTLIRISDNAGGLPKDVLESFQKENTQLVSSHGLGRGFGTFIAREIIAAHGGKLKAQNIEEGTAFEIYLPIKQAYRQ